MRRIELGLPMLVSIAGAVVTAAEQPAAAAQVAYLYRDSWDMWDSTRARLHSPSYSVAPVVTTVKACLTGNPADPVSLR